MPLVGEIYVAGLTIPALKNKIREILSRYIKDPKVQVFLEEAKSRKIYVFGPHSGGILFISRPINILDAILMAKINLSIAQTSRIFVIKPSDKKPIVFNVDFDKIIKEGDIKENVMLEPGDIVYVPGKFVYRLSNFFTLYGGLGLSLTYGASGLRVLGIIK